MSTSRPTDAGRADLTLAERGERLIADVVAGSTAGPPLAVRLVEVRKQRGKRIARYAVVLRGAPVEPLRLEQVVVKFDRRDRGAGALDALRALAAAGFAPPWRYRVPAAYGYSPAHAALVQGYAGGRPWADTLAGGRTERRAATLAAAGWTAALHAASVTAPPATGETPAAAVGRFAAELAVAFPGHAGPLLALAGRLAAPLAEPGPPVPSHGDLHPKNVRVDGDVVHVIDFDTFAAREREHDLGYAVGELLVMSQFRLGTVAPGREAAEAFLAEYGRLAGALDEARVRVHVARTLLQSLHYELCTLQNGRVELLQRWPRLAAAVLAGGLARLSDEP